MIEHDLHVFYLRRDLFTLMPPEIIRQNENEDVCPTRGYTAAGVHGIKVLFFFNKNLNLKNRDTIGSSYARICQR
jgi:hypothetical protein